MVNPTMTSKVLWASETLLLLSPPLGLRLWKQVYQQRGDTLSALRIDKQLIIDGGMSNL
jgi:hypothetical protein